MEQETQAQKDKLEIIDVTRKKKLKNKFNAFEIEKKLFNYYMVEKNFQPSLNVPKFDNLLTDLESYQKKSSTVETDLRVLDKSKFRKNFQKIKDEIVESFPTTYEEKLKNFQIQNKEDYEENEEDDEEEEQRIEEEILLMEKKKEDKK